MTISLPSAIHDLLTIFSEAGYEAYVVGGCVRDSLLGKPPQDWDITTSASPRQVMELFAGERVIETGLAHGTVTVLWQGTPVEITTFRVESTYGDHRHPDQVQFTLDLREDLARRDFTVNAMAYHPDRGLIDFFGGQTDLARRQLRCVGEPDQRFREDALRLLRALRFSATLGFPIEAATAASLHRHTEDLRYVAAERIAIELQKLLCGENVYSVLRHYDDVFTAVLPELKPSLGFAQHSRYHAYDVYEHSIRAVAAITPDPVLRFTMLLHDSGKPFTFTQDADGTGHFYGHDKKSLLLAQAAMRRLKFSHTFFDRVSLLIEHHDLRLTDTDACLKRWLGRLGEEALHQLLAVQAADCAAQAPHLLYRLEDLSRLEQHLNRLIAENACVSLRDLAVDGHDLMALGFPADATLGCALQALLDDVIEARCPNEREPLLRCARQRLLEVRR